MPGISHSKVLYVGGVAVQGLAWVRGFCQQRAILPVRGNGELLAAYVHSSQGKCQSLERGSGSYLTAFKKKAIWDGIISK